MSIRKAIGRWLDRTITYRMLIASVLMSVVLRILGRFFGDGPVLFCALVVLALCVVVLWLAGRREA